MAADFMAFQDVLWNFLSCCLPLSRAQLKLKEKQKPTSYDIP